MYYLIKIETGKTARLCCSVAGKVKPVQIVKVTCPIISYRQTCEDMQAYQVGAEFVMGIKKCDNSSIFSIYRIFCLTTTGRCIILTM